VVFEFVEAGVPHLAIWLEPLVELDEGLGAQPVEAALTIRADLDETCVA
jgi:hypothetical protein